MHNIKWDIRFLELARHISAWSHDPSTKVGAVLAKGKFVVGLGYNSFPQGVKDLPERYNDRQTKLDLTVHGEINALISAGEKAADASLYVFPTFILPPICKDCAKIAAQYRIKEVVGYIVDENTELANRWRKSINISKILLEEAGITWRGVINPNGC